MNNYTLHDVFDLEESGKTEEAYLLLEKLSIAENPSAMIELSGRYLTTDGYVFPVKKMPFDPIYSQSLAIKAKEKLLSLAESGDGEAMRQLGNSYFGHYHPIYERSSEKGEYWLVRAFNANCYFAANDLATYYQDIDVEKAKFYYQAAESHGCRVIHNSNLEK